MTTAELIDSVPRGYALAVAMPREEVKGRTDLELLAGYGVPVLHEARGVVGVLRAMAIRCGDMCQAVADDGREWLLVHLWPAHDGSKAAGLSRYTFKLSN